MEPETHSDSLLVPRNLPYLISGLYLLGFLVAFFPPLVGFIFCFVFEQKEPDSWINTHLSYQKRTFVGGLLFLGVVLLLFGSSIIGAVATADHNQMTTGSALGFFSSFMLFFVGGLLWMAWTIVRCIISILKCNDKQPMPNPRSWIW